MIRLDTSELIRLAGQFTAAAARIEPTADDVAEDITPIMARTAAANAPRLTGRLADSIRPEGSSFTASAPYAGYVERGTSRQAPQPFMRPAADTHRKQWAKNLGDAAEELLG